MKKFLFLLLFICQWSFGQVKHQADTVLVGIYINSVHDIDFKNKQYTINMWLWLKYKNPEFDFSKYLEVPMAKSVDKSFYTVDSLDDGRVYMLMKLQCVMKDSWKIHSFPFDKQKLRFSIENSQYDTRDLIFKEDTTGEHYSKWTLPGWTIDPDSFKIKVDKKIYETSFGDPELKRPRSEFSSFKVQIGIERNSWGLFLKLFMGMYVSFLLSLLCFFIHTDHIDSRFGVGVGSLFGVIGNKYVADSSLPESTSFTLVDSLHGVTLLCVLIAVACSAYSLRMIEADKINQTNHFDRKAFWSILIAYSITNMFLIANAYWGN